MELDREKLVKTSYFYIADIVEGLDTSLAYARGGFIPNYKTFDELNGKHSEQQGRINPSGTSDIWAEQYVEPDKTEQKSDIDKLSEGMSKVCPSFQKEIK